MRMSNDGGRLAWPIAGKVDASRLPSEDGGDCATLRLRYLEDEGSFKVRPYQEGKAAGTLNVR